MKSKTIAIIQPFYLPWKGYFDIIHDVDEFILYDNVKYTERSWINRNQIKTPNGVNWISIPIKTAGRYQQQIKDAEVVNNLWVDKHRETLRRMYVNTPYWNKYCKQFNDLYDELYDEKYISKINEKFLFIICEILGITTQITHSSDYQLTEGKTEKLIELCKQSDAKRYISGSLAKNYIDEQKFIEAKIELVWKNYDGYPEYSQLYNGFVHGVSIVDLIFNMGKESAYYVWGWRDETQKKDIVSLF